MLWVGFLMPSKVVKEMWLLRGGEKVRILTYSKVDLGNYFKKTIEVPLHDLTALRTRKECVGKESIFDPQN